MEFSRNDSIAALVVGIYVALFFVAIIGNLRLVHPLLETIADRGIRWLAVVIVPLSAVGLLYLFYRVGERRGDAMWFQAGKFLTTGFGGLLVDLGLLNILIVLTGTTGGILFAVMKAISFWASISHNFLWHKHWTFRAPDGARPDASYGSFLAVMIIGLGINVAVASFVVGIIPPLGGVSIDAWTNVAAVAAGIAAFFWNFFGSKHLVFRHDTTSAASTTDSQLT